MRLFVNLALLCGVAAMVACNNVERTIEVADLQPEIWSEAEEFFYDNEDSLARRNIAITLRYDRDYRADAIPVRILTVTPDSLVLEEPFTMYVPHLADMLPQEQTFIYRSNVQLQRKGRYMFRVTPDTTVAGIASVGIIISDNHVE